MGREVVLEEIRKKAEKQNDWKEVQSDGIENKCTKYKNRKYIEEQKCMKWSTVQWRSERLIGKKEKQIRIIRRSQINVFQVS